MEGLLFVCLIPVVLVFPALGFGSMVSAIAKARGRDTKRLFSVAGFLYTLLMLGLLIAWIASQISSLPELANILLVLGVLVIGFGIIIAPLIALAVRMQNPDVFKKSVAATTTTQPSNVPLTPEPEAPDQETRSAP